jgi:hypothetical protein
VQAQCGLERLDCRWRRGIHRRLPGVGRIAVCGGGGIVPARSHQRACERHEFYWLGTAQFHRMLQLRHAPANRTNEAAAKAALDAAVDALTVAVKLDERHAESHALLGTLYGMKINGSLLRGARFGPRVAKHQELALKHGASNPRVQYLLGMGQFHTAKKPAGWQAALQTLLTAEKLFEAEAKNRRPRSTPAGDKAVA